MLPIMTFEPIQINLRNCHQCTSSSSSSKTVANDNQSKTLTLYPITGNGCSSVINNDLLWFIFFPVEFNRLFRRQKQILKNENEMMMMSTTSTFELKTNVRPPNSNSLWVDNQLDASTTSDILQDVSLFRKFEFLFFVPENGKRTKKSVFLCQPPFSSFFPFLNSKNM